MNIADIRARLAAKKAEVEARLAAQTSSPAASTPPPPAASTSSSATASVSAGPAALPPKPQIAPSTVDKIAAAKKRIEAMTARSSNPYLSGSGSMPKPEVAKPTAGAMSSIALHPLLMGGQQGQEQQVEKNEKRAMRDRYKPMAPKFSSVKANVGAAPTSSGSQAPVSSAVINPYASSSTANPAADEPVAPTRRSRKIHFAPQGKYVEQGNQLRNDAKMEELKQRIIAQSKKAGLDSEFDTLERSLKVSQYITFVKSFKQWCLQQRNPPPDVEWWDKPLLNYGSTYDDIEGAIKWVTENPTESMVTHLVQHPIPIPAPGDKKADERGLMLTKKEQKKMRRQRRKAELEDKRDRQKMGLLPPDAPKGELYYLHSVRFD
jgi:U4/U6 small nuclear ribonucleoprotein PRP3